MNKKIALAVIVIFVAVLIIALSRHASRKLPDFAIEDAGKVRQISLVMNGNQLVIKNQDGKWLINDSMQASLKTVHSFLKLMEDLEIKSPMSEVSYKAFKEKNQTDPVQVRISTKGLRTHHFLLYITTSNEYGNIATKKVKGKPYILHVPGYPGDIGVFFSTRTNDWKSNILFSYGPGEISRVSIRHYRNPDDSFEVSRDTTGSYQVTGMTSHESIRDVKKDKAVRFISYFYNIRFEEFTSSGSLGKQGFEVDDTPLYSIEVEDRMGEERIVDVYPLFTSEPSTGKRTRNPDLALARINQEKDPVIVKYFLIDPVLKDLDYFLE